MALPKKIGRILALAAGLCAIGTFPIHAAFPYEAYNYLNDGTKVETPYTYTPKTTVQLSGLGAGAFAAPGDLAAAPDGTVYVSDTGNRRIVRLNADYTLNKVIDSYRMDGRTETFGSPDGLWVTGDGTLYVADTGGGQVLALDAQGNAVRRLERPDTDLIDPSLPFQPTGVCVDKYDRVFVVAANINLGILVYDAAGNFQNFLGAQRVSYNPLDYMWKRFMSDEQKARMASYIPTEYSNLTVDGSGFVYACASALDEEDLADTIESRDASGRTAPVRKLNQSGFDVLQRNGYYPPVGDVQYVVEEEIPLLSAFTDITLGPANTYTLLDTQYGRLFTYSQSGDLLSAFGAKSAQIGNSESPVAVESHGSDLLVLDAAGCKITVYTPTAYGTLLFDAQQKYQTYDFDGATRAWEQLLTMNPNNDQAYDGIGSAFMQQEKYGEAMEHFQLTGNWKYYSEAFQEYRNGWLRRYLAPLAVGVVLAAFGLVKLAGLIRRGNRKRAAEQRFSFGYELLYGFHVMVHPMDGFWDLKHEKRGSARAAGVFILLLFAVDVLQRIMTAPIFNTSDAVDMDLLQMLMNSAGLVLLFVVTNWCLTSLMDGKGTMKDIFTSCGYALVPMILFKALSIPLSYALGMDESMYLAFCSAAALIWGLGLIFLGILVTQQYTVVKNVATCALSIVGMGVILFILLLFITTMAQIVAFIQLLFYEFTR